MNSSIADTLEELGFNSRQSKVYLALLKQGSATAIQIARETGLKHPTVYDVLDVLKERSLVSETRRDGRRVFAAESPLNLHRAEERRRSALDVVLPQLMELHSRGARRPVVRCFTGGDGDALLSELLLNCRDKEYFYFGQVSAMLKRNTLEYELDYLKKRLERNVRSNAIRLREESVEPDYMLGTPENLRRVRYISLPDASDFPELYLVDDKVLIRSGTDGDFVLVIESPDLHVLLKRLWEIVWIHAEK